MAHGGPDYGVGAPIKTVYTLEDMAELAVRLGSPVSFDRRGNVIWFDDFEHSFNKWFTVIGGTGGSAAITNEKARTGALSCKVVTGDETDDTAIIGHYEPYPVLSKLGFEISLLTAATKAYIEFPCVIYDGTYKHDPGIKYDCETYVWYYYNTSGGWTAFTNAAKLTPSAYIFHTIKLVIDPDTQKYVRFIANNVETDLSAISYRHVADATNPVAGISISFAPKEDASKTIYYDDAIITQNEP